MTHEETIKLDIRIYAVEWLACQMAATLIRTNGIPADALPAMREQALSGARAKTFPGVDPAVSDHLSGELESALDRLFQMIQSLTPR